MILYFNEHIELVATVQQYEKLQPKSEAEICTETSETETTVFNMEVSKEDVTLRCCSRSYVRIYYICLCLEKKVKKKDGFRKKWGVGQGEGGGSITEKALVKIVVLICINQQLKENHWFPLVFILVNELVYHALMLTEY